MAAEVMSTQIVRSLSISKSITNDDDIKFAEVAKNSLSDAIKIDQSSQIDFEIYLADFLSKIS